MVSFPSVHTFQRSSSPKSLGQSKPNFIWSLSGMGERKFVHRVWVTWPRWPPCPYMVKTLQKSSPEPKGQWLWGLVCSIGPIIVCSNDDPRLTFTYFTARLNLVSYAFISQGHIWYRIFRKYAGIGYYCNKVAVISLWSYPINSVREIIFFMAHV